MRICGDYEGLLCFIFLESTNPFKISADQYLSVEETNLKIFHGLLESDYTTTISSVGKAFLETLQSTTADKEFAWEGKSVPLERLSEKDLLLFPICNNNTYHSEKYPDWPEPVGWPEDWNWPCDPTWVHPDMIDCGKCGKKTKCECINLPRRSMPRIKFYGEKGRGLQAVASVPGEYAYRKGDFIGELTGELVPPGKLNEWTMEVKRPDIQAVVCEIYSGKTGNCCRMINHGCHASNPPAEFVVMQVSGRYRIMVVARRHTLDGEEITAFCGPGFMKKACRCDACLQRPIKGRTP